MLYSCTLAVPIWQQWAYGNSGRQRVKISMWFPVLHRQKLLAQSEMTELSRLYAVKCQCLTKCVCWTWKTAQWRGYRPACWPSTTAFLPISLDLILLTFRLPAISSVTCIELYQLIYQTWWRPPVLLWSVAVIVASVEYCSWQLPATVSQSVSSVDKCLRCDWRLFVTVWWLLLSQSPIMFDGVMCVSK